MKWLRVLRTPWSSGDDEGTAVAKDDPRSGGGQPETTLRSPPGALRDASAPQTADTLFKHWRTFDDSSNSDVPNAKRRSIDVWNDARRARSCVRIGRQSECPVSDHLEVQQAGGRTVFNRQYHVLGELGEGQHGKVQLCLDLQACHLCAMKVCSKVLLQGSSSRRGSLDRRRGSVDRRPSADWHRSMDGLRGRHSGELPRRQRARPYRSFQGVSNSGTSNAMLTSASTATTASTAPPPPLLHPDGPAPRPSALDAPSAPAADAALARWHATPDAATMRAPTSDGDVPPWLRPAPWAPGVSGFTALAGTIPEHGAAQHQQVAQHQQAALRSVTPHESSALAFPPGAAPAPALSASDMSISREIAIMKKLQHPNIVSLHAAINDPLSNNLLLVMEYVSGGDLEQPRVGTMRWQAVPEAAIWGWVRDVTCALCYLARCGVTHGDIKPANLLLTATGAVKVADFGSAVLFRDAAEVTQSKVFGTPAFRAPESLCSGYRLNPAADMWALGVCIYVWIFGRTPFPGSTPYAIYQAIEQREVSLPDAPAVSDELRDMLHRLLDKNPLTRATPEQLGADPWITRYGSAPLEGVSAMSPLLRELPLAPTSQELASAVTLADPEAKLLTHLEATFTERRLSPGDVLFHAGDPISHVFLVVQGELRLFQETGCARPAAPDAAGGAAGGVQWPPAVAIDNEAPVAYGGGSATTAERNAAQNPFVSRQRRSSEEFEDALMIGLHTNMSSMAARSSSDAGMRTDASVQPGALPASLHVTSSRETLASTVAPSQTQLRRSLLDTSSSVQLASLADEAHRCVHMGVHVPGDIVGITALSSVGQRSGGSIAARVAPVVGPSPASDDSRYWSCASRAVGKVQLLQAPVEQMEAVLAQHPGLHDTFLKMMQPCLHDLLIADALDALHMQS